MAALDTNVVVRLIVNDDVAQAEAAERLVASERCTVSVAVLMECVWVLRACYGIEDAVIAASLRDLISLDQIDALEPGFADRALRGYEAGLDFADALHLAQCPGGHGLATFDRKLAARARRLGWAGVHLLA